MLAYLMLGRRCSVQAWNDLSPEKATLLIFNVSRSHIRWQQTPWEPEPTHISLQK